VGSGVGCDQPPADCLGQGAVQAAVHGKDVLGGEPTGFAVLAAADGARYHLSNRQMGDAITVMEHTGMARQVPTPPFPQPSTYGTSSEEHDSYLDAVDRGEPVQPSPEVAAYLDARDQHLQANYDAQVIPRHKLWTNDGWLITPDELDAALPYAPTSALDRRQRPIPWWRQWLDYLDGARGHGGVRVH